MSDEYMEKATGDAVGSPLGQAEGMGTVSTADGTFTEFASGNVGGVLNPEQSNRFIDYIFDSMVLANDGRRLTLRSNTAEIDKVQVGSRLITRATQATDTGVNKTAEFTKVDVVTTKFRLDYEFSTEALEDNIEGSGLEDHVVRLMATQFGSDLEDIAINGVAADVVTPGDFYELTLDGFIKQVEDATAGGQHFGAAAEVATLNTTTAGNTLSTFETVYQNLDRKYKSRRDQLKFYASTNVAQALINDQRALGADNPDRSESVYSGATAQVGGAAGYTTSIYGIPVLEVPLYQDAWFDLTFPSNRVWGFQRDVTVHREFKPKKDTTEYTVYVRFGVSIEEASAFSVGKTAGFALPS